MDLLKKEKLVVHVFSNIIIAVLVLVMALFSFGMGKGKTAKSTIYAGDKSSNKVSLMINVYWGTEYLKSMLETLKKHNIKTTFFVGGSWAVENPDLLRQMHEAGHEIASHGYNHKEHGKLDYKQLLKIDMELFAPPGGSYNKNTVSAASDLGYKTIMWTRDTIDWRDHDTNLIYNRAVVGMQGGDLILMHPTANTAEALEKIIEYAKNHSFLLTTVSNTLGLV